MPTHKKVNYRPVWYRYGRKIGDVIGDVPTHVELVRTFTTYPVDRRGSVRWQQGEAHEVRFPLIAVEEIPAIIAELSGVLLGGMQEAQRTPPVPTTTEAP